MITTIAVSILLTIAFDLAISTIVRLWSGRIEIKRPKQRKSRDLKAEWLELNRQAEIEWDRRFAEHIHVIWEQRRKEWEDRCRESNQECLPVRHLWFSSYDTTTTGISDWRKSVLDRYSLEYRAWVLNYATPFAPSDPRNDQYFYNFRRTAEMVEVRDELLTFALGQFDYDLLKEYEPYGGSVPIPSRA